MATSTRQSNEYEMGEAIGRLSTAVESLNNNINRHDQKIDTLSAKLETFIMDSISRKEFDELKNDLKQLKEQVSDKETAFGIMTALKKNWQFLSILAVLGGSIFGGVYWVAADIHTIAISHQIKSN